MDQAWRRDLGVGTPRETGMEVRQRTPGTGATELSLGCDTVVLRPWVPFLGAVGVCANSAQSAS